METLTLTNLANGSHNVTVYAEDEAGNIGASQTISFSADVPFPTALVITISGALATIVAAVCWFTSRKHRKLTC